MKRLLKRERHKQTLLNDVDSYRNMSATAYFHALETATY